jgi:hypothetical protein
MRLCFKIDENLDLKRKHTSNIIDTIRIFYVDHLSWCAFFERFYSSTKNRANNIISWYAKSRFYFKFNV